MDETTKKLLCEIQHRMEILKLTEYKYTVLVDYIKEEAKSIYFDRDKILRMIEILEQKPIEEIKEQKQIEEVKQEKNENE